LIERKPDEKAFRGSETPDDRSFSESKLDGETLTRSRNILEGAIGGLANIADHKLTVELRQQLTEKFERQARLFEKTLSAITDFVYIIDRDGRFLYANKALLDLWELPPRRGDWKKLLRPQVSG
jgi:PAS domain-containing protein